MNEFGLDDGRPPFGSCTGGGRSIDHSLLGLCVCMFCTLVGIRGCGEWIALIEGCDAECGAPLPGPPGAGYENGECCMGGPCVRDWGWPFRSILSEVDGNPIGGRSRNCGFEWVDLLNT